MKLVVFRGDVVESEVRLGDAVIKIGRDARNDVVLDDPQKGVSRFHCEIRPDRGRFIIVDTNSRNGVHIGGHRVRGSAEFVLGASVVVGPFELMLEGDVPATVVVSPPDSLINPPSPAPPDRSHRLAPAGGGTAARKTITLPPWLRSRQTQLWGSAALLLVVLGGLTLVVVRNLTAPQEDAPMAARPGDEPAVLLPPPPLPDDPTKDEIQRLSVEIENYLASKDAEGARSQIGRLRELAPGDPRLADFEQRLLEISTPPPAPIEGPAKPVKPSKPEATIIVGFPRKPGEPDPDYDARFRRAEVNLSEAILLLSRDELAAALSRLRDLQNESPGFRNAEQLLAEAIEKQRRDFNEAFDNGQKNETAQLLRAARGWYQRAAQIDPSSTQAAEKLALVKRLIFAKAQESMDTAGFHAKAGNKVLATRNYEEAKGILDEQDELYVKANQGLEALKR